jgi:hypothetical protein
MTQFAFLQAEFPEVFALARKAEMSATTDARGACFHSRLALEAAVKWMYSHDRSLRSPYDTALSALIHEGTFRALVGDALVTKARIIKDHGNAAAHETRAIPPGHAIIAVGYRVNSHQATKFRIWATQTLKEYIIKGFVMDDERLKQGNTAFGKDYFRELLERVRSIRASERRIYQQITDIFAECSIDYDPKAKTTREFYAHVQDKFHFAITGKTSAEIIFQNVDANLPLMGMQTFKNSPDGRVLKSDALIGKNYLSETEIGKLERTVTAFFDYIEGIIERRNTFTMEQFATSVSKFLEFNEYKVLQGFGTITREQADQKAAVEYEKFNKHQKLNSDFDKQIKRLKGNS